MDTRWPAASVGQVWCEPFQGNPACPNLLIQTCQQDVEIDCFKNSVEVKHDQQGHLLRVYFPESIIRDFDKSRFGAMILTIWWLKLGMQWTSYDVVVYMFKHRLLSRHREIVKVTDRSVV